MDIIIGGIEGGATHSKVVLFNGNGEKLVQCSGPGTNHWILGMAECQKRIHSMVTDAKKEAKLPVDKPIEALGMSLSGCEQDESNNQLKEGLHKRFPNLSNNYFVASDTVGSIAAAQEHGGLVLISGTGSNALLLNPDGSVSRCGGWGHILGDEGGAWWISHKAVKIYFDDEDNLKKAPFSTDVVWKAIKDHFNIKDKFALLDHYYSNFDKSKFAGLCKRLAEGAKQNDKLCQWLFADAGRVLALHVRALAPHAQPNLFPKSGGLPVVCVGSVWHSWEFLKPGFIKCLQEPPSEGEIVVEELSLLTLTTSMATGAAYLAAKAIKYDLPRDYKQNYKVFFHYQHNITNGN